MEKNQSQEQVSQHPIPSEKLAVEDVRFFAVGHGRSGTTWLERTLNTHPEVLCKGSGMFFGKDIESIGGRRLLYRGVAPFRGAPKLARHDWLERVDKARGVRTGRGPDHTGRHRLAHAPGADRVRQTHPRRPHASLRLSSPRGTTLSSRRRSWYTPFGTGGMWRSPACTRSGRAPEGIRA